MRGHTLDLTLRHRETGKIFVAEMECELEFKNYRYLRLTGAWQVQHHWSAAFRKFLQLARDPETFEARVGGRQMQIDGATLIWSAVSAEDFGANLLCGRKEENP